jgi:hypothetical protein
MDRWLAVAAVRTHWDVDQMPLLVLLFLRPMHIASLMRRT